MASSSYKPYVFFHKKGYELSIGLNTFSMKHLNNDKVIPFLSFSHNMYTGFLERFNSKLEEVKHRSEFQGVFVSAYGSHSCRETALDALYKVLNVGCQINHLSTIPTIVIHYVSEYGEPIDEQHKELILEFYDRFLRNSSFLVKLDEEGILISTPYSKGLISLWELSYMLWIFRHPGLIKEILNKFKDKPTTLRGVYTFLVEYFLDDSQRNVGHDSYNNRLSLSMFAFALIQPNSLMEVYQNGPVNAIQNIRPYFLIKYIREYLIKKPGIEEPRYFVAHIQGITDLLRSTILDILTLLKGEE